MTPTDQLVERLNARTVNVPAPEINMFVSRTVPDPDCAEAATRLTDLSAELAAAERLIMEYLTVIARQSGELEALRARMVVVDEKALEAAQDAGNRAAPYSLPQRAYRAAITAYLAAAGG